MKVLMFRRWTGFVLGLAAGNGQPVLLRRDADFVGWKRAPARITERSHPF
jgi:hypothetical protein